MPCSSRAPPAVRADTSSVSAEGASQHHGLVAVELPAVAVALARVVSTCASVVARARLAVREARAASRRRRSPAASACLLRGACRRAASVAPPSTTVDRYGSTTRPRPSASITTMRVERVAAQAAVGLGNGEAEQAQLGELRPDVAR